MKVSIIITAFSPKSKPYLDLLIESVRAQTYKDFETIIVSPKDYIPKYWNVRTISPDWEEDRGNDAAINFGISRSSPESKYYFILNDDVLLTFNALEMLMVAAERGEYPFLMPISNDHQWRYNLAAGFESGDSYYAPHSKYTYADIKDIAPSLIKTKSIYPHGFVYFDTLCLYAVLMSKSVYEKVGPFEEKYKTGPSDIDYCIRARQCGIQPAIQLSSLVFHAGGATADLTLTEEMREKNRRVFQDKWG